MGCVADWPNKRDPGEDAKTALTAVAMALALFRSAAWTPAARNPELRRFWHDVRQTFTRDADDLRPH